MLHVPAFFCLFRASHWWHPMEKSEYQPKEALFEEVFEPDKGQGPNAVDSEVQVPIMLKNVILKTNVS